MQSFTKICFLTIILVIQSFLLFSQKETNNWIMGLIDMWVVFTDSGPLPYSPPNNVDMIVDFFESSGYASSVSDKDGNLLLYTNGEVVWNSHFNYVPGGWNMASDLSTCLIVPTPSNPYRYYVFSSNPWGGPYGGGSIKVKQIDYTLNNGEGGATLNQLIGSSCVGKFSTHYHANGKDVWLLTHGWNNNTFRAYLITEQELPFNPWIDTSAVISNCGIIQQDTAIVDLFNSAAWGQMKFSPGGNYVAMTSTGIDVVEIFDFNRETGIVSNPRTINIDRPFGIEFSSNGTYLYFSQYFYCYNPYPGCSVPYQDSIPVYQVDLLAGNDSAINNSMVSISYSSQINLQYGGVSLQLASNKKIYCNHGSLEIPVINEPNLAAHLYQWNDIGIAFPNGYPGNGPVQFLPDFFRSYLDFNIMFDDDCYGSITMIFTLTNQGFDSIRWEFEDTLAGLSFSIPDQDTVYHTFAAIGEYEITLKRYRHGNLDELKRILRIKPEVYVFLPNDTVICEGELVSFSVADTLYNFAWVNDFSTDTVFSDTVIIEEAGTWWPMVTNYEETCGHIDSVQVIVQYDTLGLGQDNQPLCSLNPAILDATLPGNCSYQWSTGDTTPTITATDNGYYAVTVQQNYCTVFDTILILYDEPIQIELEDTLMFCDSISLILDAGDFPAVFMWSPTGDTTAAILVENPGLYSVVASNACGSESGSTQVLLLEIPLVELGSDSTFCLGDTFILQNQQAGNFEPCQYQWSTGATMHAIPVFNPGTYAMTVSNICGTGSDTVSFSADETPVVDLGNDTVLCAGDSLVLSTASLGNYLWSPNGETVPSITVYGQDMYSLSVSNACGTYSDAIVVMFDFPLNIDLGETLSICSGDSAYLENTAINLYGPDAWLWSTGSTNSAIWGSDAGIYSLSITNACGVFSDSMYLHTDTALSINLGNDTIICPGENLLVSAPWYPFSEYLWSTGETGYSISVNDSGSYSLSVSNACGTHKDSILVNTHQNLFAFLPDSIPLDTNQSLTLDAGPWYYDYYWSTTETTQTISVDDPGYYWVEVIDSIGCLGSDTILVYGVNSISSTLLSQVKVYPNPVKDELIIEFRGTDYKSAPAHVVINLWNSLGQEVARYANVDLTQSDTFGIFRIDMSGLPKGIYLLSIRQGNEKMVVNVVKE